MGDDPAFNLQEALARVDQDQEILQMMVELFLEQGLKDLADIKAAVVGRDAAAVARSAHRLKGAVLQFCAPSAIAVTAELEQLGKSGDIGGVDAVYDRVAQELHRLLAALRTAMSQGLAA